MDVDDSLKCSFIHLFIYSSFILANDGGGGGGWGGWRQGVLCYTHMFCSLFHTQEPSRRSLGIILCCCIFKIFFPHAPVFYLRWQSASLCNDQWFIRRVGSVCGPWKTFCINKTNELTITKAKWFNIRHSETCPSFFRHGYLLYFLLSYHAYITWHSW